MKLTTFTITNFRSIKHAHKIQLSNYTTIIGRNNEGKSNILKALDISIKLIQIPTAKRALGYSRREDGYIWSRDFPIEYQENPGNRKSVFNLEFELSDHEASEFRKKIKSGINGYLPIQIEIDKNGKIVRRVVKKGRAGASLTSKSEAIAAFIAEHIVFNYIPAIRTEEDAKSVVRDLVRTEMISLDKKEEYVKALEVLETLRKPILKNVSENILKSLEEFIPNIKGVDVDYADSLRMMSHRGDVSVVINDGTPTNLEYKGDGVKSLVTLGLLKNRYVSGIPSIIAIEEPESHLHPAAIHRLKAVIQDLSSKSQVIISSHNPLFVNRIDMRSNIVVENGNATTSRAIRQIRELLGVKPSDNLINAQFVILVEGETDQIILKTFIKANHVSLWKKIESGNIAISIMGGITQLRNVLSIFTVNICETYIIADNDSEAVKQIQSAISLNDFDKANYTLLTVQNMNESELEDLVKPSVYLEEVCTKYGITIRETEIQAKQKWSDRFEQLFKSKGKIWNKDTERELKYMVARAVERQPQNAMIAARINVLDECLKRFDEKKNKLTIGEPDPAVIS